MFKYRDQCFIKFLVQNQFKSQKSPDTNSVRCSCPYHIIFTDYSEALYSITMVMHSVCSECTLATFRLTIFRPKKLKNK